MIRLRISIIALFLILSYGVVINADSHQQLDFFRSLSIEELMDIKVVTASRVPEKLSESTSNVMVITAADLKRMGARSYHDALLMKPGFSVYTKNVHNKVIPMRGIHVADSPGILTLLNGHVLNPPRSGGAANQFADEIPVESIKQIEIIKGPGSALYGANAFLGVINIITKSADDIEGLKLFVGTEFESGNNVGQSYNLLYGKRFEDQVGLVLNLNWLNHSGPEIWAGPDAFDRSGYISTGRNQFDSYVELEMGEFVLTGRYYHRSGDGGFGVLNVIEDRSELGTQGGHIEAEWIHELNKSLQLEILAYVDHITSDNYYVGFVPGTAPPESVYTLWNDTGIIANAMVDETSFGEQLQLTYRGWKDHIVVGGIAHRYESQHNAEYHANFNPVPLPAVRDVSSEYNWLDNAHRNIMSAYIEDIWDINDSLRLTTGARFDHFSDFGSSVNPRVGLAWEINEEFDVKMSYGTAFRAPAFGTQYVKNNPALTGNPDLEPEEMKAFETSIGYRYRERFHGRITYYYTDFKEMIEVAPSTVVFDNLGEVEVNGVEIEGSYFFEHGGYTRVYYTMNNSRQGSGISSPNVPDRTAGYELNLPLGNILNWNVNAYWQSETGRVTGDPREEMNDYIIVNSTVMLHNLWENLEIRFSVFNLFDKDYAYPSPVNTYPNDYPAPGRSIAIEAKWHF